MLVGLMSGTSLDGVDAVLATEHGADLAHLHLPLPPALREELLALNTPGTNELHRAALAGNALAHVYAQAVSGLLESSQLPGHQVLALGAHGQTVRHQPLPGGQAGYSLQLLNGALLAELTGIDVVCDFRSRDLAAGGQGAPLVPAFHAARFAEPQRDVAVLNIGGIANLSLLPASGPVLGFDCGPGNMLLDAWSQQHLGQPYDAGGRWAAQGQVQPALLAGLLAEPYFAMPAPKSTGRELFDSSWLARQLAGHSPASAVDVAATLAELTAQAAVSALHEQLPRADRLVVCGGGAHNEHLMQRLQALAGNGLQVCSSAALGLAPDRVEALAFAWLAGRFLARQAGNLPAVTGARGPRILGALYPA